MLQHYLNANLLALKDDADFKKLKKSSDDIARSLKKNKAKILPYTLIAIDPNISGNNTYVIQIKESIIKNWSTFAANTKDTPSTYIRAVILEALDSLAEDVDVAVIIWLTAKNIVKHLKLTSDEHQIVFPFILKCGSRIDKLASSTWALPSVGNSSKIEVELKQITSYLINDTSLRKYLEDASGPSNEQGETNFESPNPSWPNSGANWSYQFAPRATKGIKTMVDLSLKAIATVVNENQKKIQTIINSSIEEAQKEFLEKSRLFQLRSELLWWKEAGYSLSTNSSYKDLDSEIVEIIIALDYSSFIPVIYPASVDYFLRETYSNLKNRSLDELSFEEFLKSCENNSSQLREFIASNMEQGKITLLGFIGGLIWGDYTSSQFEDLVGFSPKTKVKTAELATWLFNDFQLINIFRTA